MYAIGHSSLSKTSCCKCILINAWAPIGRASLVINLLSQVLAQEIPGVFQPLSVLFPSVFQPFSALFLW